jgi:hypothetical protein
MRVQITAGLQPVLEAGGGEKERDNERKVSKPIHKFTFVYIYFTIKL